MQAPTVFVGGATLQPAARRRRVLAAAAVLSLALNALPFVSGWEGATRTRPAAPVFSARIIEPAVTTQPPSEPRPAMPPLQAATVLDGPQGTSPAPTATTAPPASTAEPHAASTAPAVTYRPPEPAAPVSTADEASRPPRPLGDIVPAYPEGADGKRGHVVLQLSIDDQGRVVRADVLDASPPGYFEDSARAAFLAARFEPALRNGAPVRSRITIEVDYEPGDRDGAVSSPRY